MIGNFFLSLTICKVFSKVTATLDPTELNISPHEVEQLLDKIKAKIGVSFEYKERYFLIHGSLRAINDCQLLLQKFLMPDENISDELGNCSLNVEDVSAGKEKAINKTLTSKTSDSETTGGVIIATPVYDVAEEKDLYCGKIDTEETEGVAHPLISDIQTFNTDPLAVSFIRQFYAKQVQDISKDCLVSFDIVNSDTQVTLQPTQDCDPVRYNEACSKFVMVLNSASQGMSTWELDLKSKDKEVTVSLIQYLSSEFPVVLGRLQENGPFVVYGDTASVEQVKLSLEERVHEQTVGGDVLFETQQMALAGGSVSIVTYSYRTEGGVNISLRYGDITSENVDAIVNPANEFLQHIAGLAGYIVEKGGPDIQSESDELISEKRRGRPLSLGEAVYTKAGNLPCKYVIHAVGPEWEKQSKKKTINLLHTACVESLKLASKLCLSSIALPAISSGVFRVPIDLCASSMLNGVEQYLEQLKKAKLQKKEDDEKADVIGTKAEKEKNGKKTMKKASEQKTGGVKEQEDTTLGDIRFMLIDADAMDVFEKECIKRFSENQTNPSSDDESL